MNTPNSPSPSMTDEARRQIAWRRLIEDALRHGYAKRARKAEEEKAEENENATESVTAGQVAFDSEAGNEQQQPSATR
jgi:hypothetical protein